MRIKAFTYLELLFVIVLSSIVFVSGYFAVGTANRNHFHNQRKQTALQELSFFDLHLRKIFHRSVEERTLDESLVFKDAAGRKQQLIIEDDFMILNSLQSDTLFCHINEFGFKNTEEKIELDILFKFEGQEYQIYMSKDGH